MLVILQEQPVEASGGKVKAVPPRCAHSAADIGNVLWQALGALGALGFRV